MIGLSYGNFQAVTQESFSFGNALQFDGVNDSVSFSEISLASDFTISFWIKYPDPYTIGVDMVFAATSDINNYFWVNDTQVRLVINGVFFNASFNVTDGNWHNITITRSGTTTSLYADANLIGTQTQTGALKIGQFGRYNGGLYMDAVLDEFAIWDTALSSTDISNLYNSGNGDYATNYSPANLQAYWRMNGSGTDTTAVDEQGNYDGTLNNFPASGMWVAH